MLDLSFSCRVTKKNRLFLSAMFSHPLIICLFPFQMCRSCWIFGFQFVCEEDLQKYQVRLEHLREEMELMELSRVDWPLLRYVVRDGDPATTRDRNRRVEDRECILSLDLGKP